MHRESNRWVPKTVGAKILGVDVTRFCEIADRAKVRRLLLPGQSWPRYSLEDLESLLTRSVSTGPAVAEEMAVA